MTNELIAIPPALRYLAIMARTRHVGGDAGMTTETVIIVAALAALALGVTTIIATKVTDKAETLDLDQPAQQAPAP
jgi:hypothetical protein